MIGALLWCTPGLTVAGACVVGIVYEIRRWPRAAAQPSELERLIADPFGDLDELRAVAELEAALSHVEAA